ncbi:endocuticle structural glycoprotein SgAbd-4-like [Daphnia pulex]|uniref:endocuticle structural glycoprotein SgAbd-4-like n=1 Tax=Daphnia pulex TaxID=6669 RepID=UPI001EDEA5D7|nr:endocuticle structural glycoprotein SgAbd-4-like [Daphnia pulex]
MGSDGSYWCHLDSRIPSTMKVFIFGVLISIVAAGSIPAYGDKHPAIVSQSDVRNIDGSSQWSFAGSDGTTREESQIQKQLTSGYDKETASGNTNKGSTYYISPEGQKITLTWISDENGFQPKGDHLPTPPPVPEEIARMLSTLPKLAEPYKSV